MGGRSLGRLLVIGVLVGSSREATAQMTLLIESYADERPPDADRVLAPLRDRLQRRGTATTAAAIAALLGHQLPLPGAAEPTLTAAELAERVHLGFASAARGDYRLAIRQLEAALASARESPSIVVADASAPAWLTRALAGLAFARGRMGDLDGAAEAMAEQLRSFPEHPVMRNELGPEAEKLYGATRRALEAAPRGSLLVDVSEPGARIYVNEVGRGRGGTFAGALLPGTYRILVEASGTGRRYTARVRAGETTRLSIDWDVDARLVATPRWVGCVWPRGAQDGTARLAQRLARGGAADGVIVVEIVRRGERRFTTGRVYRRAAGSPARAAEIELGGRDAERLVALADYLAGGERTDEAVRILGDPGRDHARGSRALVWASAGVAAAALGTGAYLLHLDGRGTCGAIPIEQCPRLYDTAPLGWTLIGGGIAAVALGASWYAAHAAHAAHAARGPALTLGRSRAGTFAALAWSFSR
jgi:hypothetical protein